MSGTTSQDGAGPVPTPGRVLANARAARGMTVTEVALRLKFAPRQIEALEADRYEALAGPAFVRGMLRGYAKLVGVDAEPLIAALRERFAPPGPLASTPLPGMQVPFPRAARRGSFAYLALSGLLIVAVAGVLVEWLLPPEQTAVAVAPQAAAPAPAPVAEQAAPPAAAPQPAPQQQQVVATAAEKRIELVFDGECWVEIRDADGRVLFSQLNRPGTRREVAGDGPFSLVIGNAAGVKVRFNDTDIDLKPFTRTDVARLTLE
jgi:cytoskeleton protein RodZ